MLKLSLFILFLAATHLAAAYDLDSIKTEVGLGHSDNVYQDDLYKKSDFFTWLQLRSRNKLPDSSLIGKVSLLLYSKEKANNSISYSLMNRSEPNYNQFGVSFGLGGLSYLQSEAGSTDEAFNHFYGLAYLSKNIMSKISLDLIFEPGLKISSYPQLDNRRDLILFAKLDADWKFRHNTELNPYLELGFLFSNQSYYTKRYLDIGLSWYQSVDYYYKFNVDLFVRNSSYPNRRISDILILPRRNGRYTSVAIDTNESTSLTQLAATLIRTDDNRELTLGFNVTSQNSLSHLEYYNELQLLASAAWSF